MTGQIKSKPQNSIICFVWLLAISIFSISVGLKLTGLAGQTIVFDSIGYHSLREAIVGLSIRCAADVASFLLITIASKPYASMALSSVILAMRGVSLGACSSFCAVNAISDASVAMIISFALVSLLMLLYAVFVSRAKLGFCLHLLIYFLITGASALLRLLPVMLI